MTTTNSAGVLAPLTAEQHEMAPADFSWHEAGAWMLGYNACADKHRTAVAELQAKARLWDVVRQYASGDDFDRWEEMAHGGHIGSDAGNTYADERAAALAALAGNGKERTP